MKSQHQQTPWQPHLASCRRVKDAIAIPTRCNHCNSLVQVKHHSEVYGKVHSSWPWLYRCSGCKATVGMHPRTNIPLGTLATREEGRARIAAKTPFEKLYLSGFMSRRCAYQLLAQHLNIPPSKCHFGMFDLDLCEKASIAVTAIYDQLLFDELHGCYSDAA